MGGLRARPTRSRPRSRRRRRRAVAPLRTVRLATDRAEADAKIEGPALWRRSEPGTSAALAEALAADLDEWSRDMRRLLTFACEGAELAGSLDGGGGATGLLLVTGGSQTRIGSHRMYERLAKSLADNGYPCFRFDRRGVGDSDGEDPGFQGSGPDLAAAAAAFRRRMPCPRRACSASACATAPPRSPCSARRRGSTG